MSYYNLLYFRIGNTNTKPIRSPRIPIIITAGWSWGYGIKLPEKTINKIQSIVLNIFIPKKKLNLLGSIFIMGMLKTP